VADQVKEQIRRIVRILLEDRATTKILLSDALGVDPTFDRKLLSFYDEMSSLLEGSLRDGRRSGSCETVTCAHVVADDGRAEGSDVPDRAARREYDEDKLVDGTFAYFTSGYLRVSVD